MATYVARVCMAGPRVTILMSWASLYVAKLLQFVGSWFCLLCVPGFAVIADCLTICAFPLLCQLGVVDVESEALVVWWL